MEAILILSWLSAVVSGPYVATQKGRSMIEGFCFALFFGPLGLVIESNLPVQNRSF